MWSSWVTARPSALRVLFWIWGGGSEVSGFGFRVQEFVPNLVKKSRPPPFGAVLGLSCSCFGPRATYFIFWFAGAVFWRSGSNYAAAKNYGNDPCAVLSVMRERASKRA